MSYYKRSLPISVIIPSSRENPLVIPHLIFLTKAENVDMLFVTDKENNELKEKLENNNIRFIYTKKKQASLKRNLGASLAFGEILCFTDDDCVVTPEWIEEVKTFFSRNHDVNIVFGKTLPYLKGKRKNTQCVGTFEKIPQKNTPFKDLPHHSDSIGISNNFAIRKELFNKLGGFKSWLGPGSIGSNGEDADLIVRTLLLNEKIGYEPNMVIYHNHWLVEYEFKKQNASYICGGIATYGYHALKGVKGCSKIAVFYFWEGVKDILYFLKSSLKNPLLLPKNVYGMMNTSLMIFRGLLVAVFFSMKE